MASAFRFHAQRRQKQPIRDCRRESAGRAEGSSEVQNSEDFRGDSGRNKSRAGVGLRKKRGIPGDESRGQELDCGRSMAARSGDSHGQERAFGKNGTDHAGDDPGTRKGAPESPADVYESGTKKALLEIDLGTGRHHQIRLQLSHAGMPIVGDRKYGVESCREVEHTKKRWGEHGNFPALCAFRLIFTDPWSKARTEIRALPEGENFKSFGENRLEEI